jgi:hypothetical protein
VINLSIKGAFLSSQFQPYKGNSIAIALKTSLLKKELIIEGKVIRVANGLAEEGARYQFGVRFDYTPLDLIELVNKIVSQPPSFSPS